MQENSVNTPTSDPPGMGWIKLSAIIIASTIVATLIAVWAVTQYLFPDELKPVTLSAKEEQTLKAKLERLDSLSSSGSGRSKTTKGSDAPLQPERYSEANANRTLKLSERELNSLLAKNTDLAKKLAIDLSDDLASAKLLIPLDEDFPVLGGKTLRVNAGMELSYAEGRPIVVLKGVSIWGTPIPNAWLGNLKNVDLVREFGAEEGFWKSFADGVDHIKIEEGNLAIRLKE
jgi:hypothetical protein